MRRAFGHRCHWNLGSCALWKGKPGAIGSTSFHLSFLAGKLTEMDNPYVFTDL